MNRHDRSIHPREKFRFERSHQINHKWKRSMNPNEVSLPYHRTRHAPIRRDRAPRGRRREGPLLRNPDRREGGRLGNGTYATINARERRLQHRGGPCFFACGPRVRRPMVPIGGGLGLRACRAVVPTQLQRCSRSLQHRQRCNHRHGCRRLGHP